MKKFVQKYDLNSEAFKRFAIELTLMFVVVAAVRL